MGQSASCLPQLVQVAIWPHSSNTQSIDASIQILHCSSSQPLPSPLSSTENKSNEDEKLGLHKVQTSNHKCVCVCVSGEGGILKSE